MALLAGCQPMVIEASKVAYKYDSSLCVPQLLQLSAANALFFSVSLPREQTIGFSVTRAVAVAAAAAAAHFPIRLRLRLLLRRRPLFFASDGETWLIVAATPPQPPVRRPSSSSTSPPHLLFFLSVPPFLATLDVPLNALPFPSSTHNHVSK